MILLIHKRTQINREKLQGHAREGRVLFLVTKKLPLKKNYAHKKVKFLGLTFFRDTFVRQLLIHVLNNLYCNFDLLRFLIVYQYFS